MQERKFNKLNNQTVKMSIFKNGTNFNNYYSLEPFFDLYFNDMKSKGALSVFPNLKELLNKYLIKLSQMSIEEDLGDYQFFRKQFDFPQDCFYIVEWNIQKAIAITKNNIEKKDLPIDVLLRFNKAHKEGLDNNNININLDELIIAVYYPPTQEIIIIDGNHRFYTAVEQKHKSISAYVLYPDTILKAMSNDLCRALYKIHNNINVMTNIIAGNLKLDQNPLEKGLDRFFEFDEI